MFQQTPSVADKNYKVASEAESLLKTILLVLFTATAAGFTGYFIIKPSLVYGILSMVLFFILFVLQNIFIKSWQRSAVALFIESFAIVITMALNLTEAARPYLIYVWAMLLFSFGTALYFTFSKMGNSVRIPFWKITRAVLIKTMTGIFLVALAIYIFIMGPVTPQGDPTPQFKATEKAFTSFVVAPAVRSYAPDLPKSENLTVDDMVKAIVLKYIRTEKPAFDTLPEAEKQQIMDASLAATKANMVQRLGEVDFSASPMLAIYNLTAELIGALNPFGQTVAIAIIILGLWLMIKTAMLVLFIPFALVSFLVYETLIVSGFATIEYEARSAEIVVMK